MAVRKASRLKDRVCQVCGNTFQARKSNAKFCSPNCKSTDQRNRMKAVKNGLTIEQARVVIITPELIKVSKDRTCQVCKNTFQGNKKALYCSDACRLKAFRSRKNTDTSLLRETVTAQSKVIHDQSKMIDTVLPTYLFDPRYHAEQKRIDKLTTQAEKDKAKKDIVEKLSAKTGKDLTECKRPDGKHLYTDRDLLILIARLTRETIRWQSGHIMDIMAGYQNYDNAIKLFENIFDCTFDDVKKANPDFEIGKTKGDLIQQYANLEYSKPYQWKH